MDALQQEILDAALPDIAFDGWDDAVLRKAAESLGKPPQEAQRAFPGGAVQALNLWTAQCNEQLEKLLRDDYNLESMKIRERIATGVMARLRMVQPHREAIRKGHAMRQMPWHAPDGLKDLYALCDVIWRAAGDSSTDWNFYSKRLLLAKVFASTMIIWLDDDSPNQEDTEAFLYRRIEDVMKIQKFKFGLAKWKEKLVPEALRPQG